MRVNVDGEAEVGGQIAADLAPVVAGIVGAHHVPVLLHEEDAGALRGHGDVMHAVADFGGGVGDVLGVQAAVDGLPGFATVIGTKCAGRGDGDKDALGIGGVEHDGVQAQAACAGLPAFGGVVLAQAGKFRPVLAAVGGLEEGGVFHAGIDLVRVGERGLKVPDALELPRVRRAVVPLVGAGRAFVGKLVADRLPGFAAIVGALDDLPIPAGGWRRSRCGWDRRANP